MSSTETKNCPTCLGTGTHWRHYGGSERCLTCGGTGEIKIDKDMSEHQELGEGSVVRDWVTELPWKQQTVLLSAIRGCDGVSKHDPSKEFVRPLRGLILKNAEPDAEDDTFMHHPSDDNKVENFAHDLDNYPMHWVIHFLHAVEIIGYKHPDELVRQRWNKLYVEMVREGFHLRMESPEQLDKRLQP